MQSDGSQNLSFSGFRVAQPSGLGFRVLRDGPYRISSFDSITAAWPETCTSFVGQLVHLEDHG